MEETCSFWPAMAVPTTVKIPEPMTAPIPREVRLSQPSDFFNRRSGSSASEISLSIFLTRNRPESTRHHPTVMLNRGTWKLYLVEPVSATAGTFRDVAMCAKTLYLEYAERLGPAEIRVSFHEFFCSVVGEADGKFALVAIAFNNDDRARAVGGVADTLADERIACASRAAEARLRSRTRSAGRDAARA